MRLIDANQIYDTAEACTATREAVDHPGVATFVQCTRQLLAEAAPHLEDELASALVRVVKRARWNMHSTPMHLSAPELGLGALAAALARHAEQASVAYGERVADPASEAAALLSGLAQCNEDPMGSRIAEILGTGRRAGRPSWSGARRSRQRSSSRCSATAEGSPSSPRSSSAASRRSRPWLSPVRRGWYQAHVIGAPRAEQLCFVHYGWIRDEESGGGLIEGARSTGVTRRIRIATPAWPVGGDTIDARDLAPEVDWAALVSAPGVRGQDDRVAEPVQANAFLLAGDHLVYLPAAEGPRVDVIDLDPDSHQVVQSRPARSVAPGDYLLLRSVEAGEDYLQAVANTRLGADAAQLRDLQAHWKEALWRYVMRNGHGATVQAMFDGGAAVANIGYWLLPDSIRTQNPSDFEILMGLIGLGPQTAELWEAMGRIRRAHTWAGAQIRKLLEEQILRSDLTELHRSGQLDCELEGVDAGALSIFRVEGRSPEPVMVQPSWLRWPRKLDPER